MEEESTVNPLVPSAYDIVWSCVWLAVVVCTVVALVSLIRSRRATGLTFLLWFALIAMIPVLGATAWFLGGREPRPASSPARSEGIET